MRACAAVLRDGCVLMVRSRRPDGTEYWTLPGGHLEDGESAADCAVRELREEARLAGRIERHLFDQPYAGGISSCFLVTVAPEAEPALGGNPEPGGDEILAVAWRPLRELADDIQVRRVLAAL